MFPLFGAAISSVVGAAATVGTVAAGAAATAGAVAVGAAATAGTAVVGAATTAGAIAAGAAATAGTAIASTAVGSAAIGAAATAGTAIAGSAVGGAALGAMTAVGTGIGVAATAASSAPVIGAAATALSHAAVGAGATAIGTVATTGAVGVANGVAGAVKLSEADDIKTDALSRYKSAKKSFSQHQKRTNVTLQELGEEKVKIWSGLNRFSIMFEKIHNKPKIDGQVSKESIALTADELDNIKAVAISAQELLSGGIGSIGAGGLIGIATSSGLVSTITYASTTTAISSLSGAAATNATLAALGGGAIKVGGAGMAGGTAVLGGLTFAPMIMVSGIMLNGRAKKSLEAAKDTSDEVDLAVEKMKIAQRELEKMSTLAKMVHTELNRLNAVYLEFLGYMENVVLVETDYERFTPNERAMLEKTVLSVTLIKHLSLQNILDSENDNAVLETEVKGAVDGVTKTRMERLQCSPA